MCSRRWDWCPVPGLLLLLSLLVTSIQDPSVLRKMAVSGSNVSLKISEELFGNYKQLIWFYNTSQKIVEWEVLSPAVYYRSSLKDRLSLDPQSPAHLHISKVQKEDSSTYILRVSKESGKEQEWKIPLQVFDPVPEPIIETEKAEEVNGNCYLTLSCVIQDQSVSYVWYGDSGPFPKELQKNVLEVTLNTQNQSRFYTCQVSNPVSSKNDTVYFIPPCTIARSSAVMWIVSWWMVVIPTAIGLLLTHDELL
ncbi:CD48 antigen [Sciurus carolinensis]|uniref:CD48 antigen n=1 Tax=Sciurus carolinensis TaxID=30640 RepID=UPI001FB2D5A8|nr:CD48 antigen [Sciurus carolinensis]